MTTPIAPLTAERLREIEEYAAFRQQHSYMGGKELERLAALLADARAMRELVRRALIDRLVPTTNDRVDEYTLICDECENFVVVPRFARSVAHPSRGVCTCAPGASWVRDAINAGLHEELKS